MGIFNHVGGGGEFYPYKIDQSCRFNSADSAYQFGTFGVPTDGTLWTYSTWMKRGNITTAPYLLEAGVDDTNRTVIYLTGDTLAFYSYYASGQQAAMVTLAVLRDVSSWYHFVGQFNSAADTFKFFINGVEAAQTTTTVVTDGVHYINLDGISFTHCRRQNAGSQYYDGYLAETHFVDGQALTPASFGTTRSGVWVPIRYTGTYGNNGFYLDYSNSSDFGEDQSGNGNDLTDSGLATNDQVEDSPTNNYCVMNPNSDNYNVFSNGNLDIITTTTQTAGAYGTHEMTSGKWYWEALVDDITGVCALGISASSKHLTGAIDVFRAEDVIYTSNTGNKTIGGAGSGYGAAYAATDRIGIAFDVDGQTIEFYKNNASQGSIDISAWMASYTGFLACVGDASGSELIGVDFDFGQLGFTYTPPVDYKALCSANLPEPEILEGNTGMDALTYTGDGTTSQTIDGLEFQPDLVWMKSRSNAHDNILFDSIRGIKNAMFSNATSAEVNQPLTGYLDSFLSDGFTARPGAVSADMTNENTKTYVAWNWKEDPKYGFDIQTFVGTFDIPDPPLEQLLTHDLGVIPEMIITKARDGTANWAVYHKDLNGGTTPEDFALILNTTAAEVNEQGYWWDYAPTSQYYTAGPVSNIVDINYVTYLFASIPGYSKVFSYTGNADVDGPFVYCGFRPRYVLLKSSSDTGAWVVYDTARDTYNASDAYLLPGAADAEVDNPTYAIDILSNGFKIRTIGGSWNADGVTFIGITFAEHPFKYSNAR